MPGIAVSHGRPLVLFNDDHPGPTIAGPVPRARADANQDGNITQEDLIWLINFLLDVPEP
jgi:hypothetical protein